jgi:Sulfatase-modifying factor enzyme 1
MVSTDDIADLVGQVLAANDAVEIWNFPDDILRKAARGWQNARHSESFLEWVAARLKQKLSAEQWTREFAGVKPRWPQAVAFPVADDRCGAMAFVSMKPGQPLPRAKYDVASLTSVAQKVADWFTRLTDSNLQPSVWIPGPATGESIGLAALTACLIACLEQCVKKLSPLVWNQPLTGVLNFEKGCLQPAKIDTFARKGEAAHRLGFERLYVVSGQGGRSSVPSIQELPSRISDALWSLLQDVMNLNPALFGHFETIKHIAVHLSLPLTHLEDFLPGVLTRLTEGAHAHEIASLRVELNLPPDPGKGSARECWERLVNEYVSGPENLHKHRRKKLCHLMMERHDQDYDWLPLANLTMYLNRRIHIGTLIAENAVREIDSQNVREPDAPSLEEWLRIVAIAGCVGREQQQEFVNLLVKRLGNKERRDWRLAALAIVAARRLYGWDKEQPQALRTWIGEALHSRPLPANALVHQRVDVPCRDDFHAVLGAHDPGRWQRRRRAEKVAMGRFPVTNADYQCFDPTHEARDDCPVVGVSWYQAFVFAFWAGLALPRRGEWIAAAILDREWASPYQFREFSSRTTCYGAVHDGPLAVAGRKPLNPGQCECVDMSGNVWEWVLDWCPPRADSDEARGSVDCKMALGGSWKSSLNELRLTTFCPLPPTARQDDVGFRCLKVLRG